MTLTNLDRATEVEIASPQLMAWLPLIVLPAASFFVRDRLPAWGFMWLMSFSLFAGCKWLTWWKARPTSRGRSVAYLLLWPGMDAGSFTDESRQPPHPSLANWLFALLKTLIGVLLIWPVAPR